MSLAGLGVDAVEDAAAAALGLCTHTLGWGLQQVLPQPALEDVVRVLPQGWIDRLGLSSQAFVTRTVDNIVCTTGYVRVD